MFKGFKFKFKIKFAKKSLKKIIGDNCFRNKKTISLIFFLLQNMIQSAYDLFYKMWHVELILLLRMKNLVSFLQNVTQGAYASFYKMLHMELMLPSKEYDASSF